jgi:hypothetical protein
MLFHNYFSKLRIPSQQGSQSSGATVLNMADRHPGEAAPIGVSQRKRGFGDAQTPVTPLVAIRKKGCDAGVGNIWQGQEGGLGQGERGGPERWVAPGLVIVVSGTPSHAGS